MKKAEKINYEKIFFAAMLVGFVLWVIFLFCNPTGVQKNVFFAGCQDFFADFFNVLRFIDERNPYFITGTNSIFVNYLPISYLIFYPFTVFNDYAHMSLRECWGSVSAMMSVILYTISLLFLLFHSLALVGKKFSDGGGGNEKNTLTVWAVLFSNIFLFSLERGNIILLSAVFLNYFLVYYDSKNKWLRIFAAFSIAMASALKIYPVFFGLLYFEKKQWGDIFSAFIFGVLLTFLPFFFFDHGLANLPRLFTNVSMQSKSGVYRGGMNYLYGFAGIVYYFFEVSLGAEESVCNIMSVVCTNIIRLMAVGSLFMSWLSKDRFLKIALIVFPVLYFPTNSGFYSGLYLFPLLILFFTTAEERGCKLNAILLIMFVLMFTPLQWGFTYKIYFNMNYETSNFIGFALWIISFVVSVIRFTNFRSNIPADFKL